MVAEIIAGITLCNSAYKAIKECIGNAKDVGQIAGHLDNLIDGKSQIDQAVKPSSIIASKWSRMMGSKGIENVGSLSLGSIAQEKINQKLAEEELRKVRSMVNRRFGLGTWEDIIMERDERIKKSRTAAQKQRLKNQEKIEKWFEIIKNTGILIAVIIGMGIVWMLYTTRWGFYMEGLQAIGTLWPILIAIISLIVVLAKMHYAIGVLEEKIKVAFDLINKISEKR